MDNLLASLFQPSPQKLTAESTVEQMSRDGIKKEILTIARLEKWSQLYWFKRWRTNGRVGGSKYPTIVLSIPVPLDEPPQ